MRTAIYITVRILLYALAKWEPPALLGRVKKLQLQAKRAERKNFTITDKLIWDKQCPFTGCRASDARDRLFSASWEACRYDALPGLTQAPGLAGGHDLDAIDLA